MEAAHVFAKLSYAKKLKVGAIAVKNNTIISIGYNGTAEGEDNCCEDIVMVTNDDGSVVEELKTKPSVIHAEANLIYKLAKSTESAAGATIFTTFSPCYKCSLAIAASGITEVYYDTPYHKTDGIEYLLKRGIMVKRLICE
jgi:dCMP deaminase